MQNNSTPLPEKRTMQAAFRLIDGSTDELEQADACNLIDKQMCSDLKQVTDGHWYLCDWVQTVGIALHEGLQIGEILQQEIQKLYANNRHPQDKIQPLRVSVFQWLLKNVTIHSMQLWLLRPTKQNPLQAAWPNKSFGYVIRARTQQEARKLAHRNADDLSHNMKIWLDDNYTTCESLINGGNPKIILTDHRTMF